MPTSEPGPLLPDDHPLMAAMTKRDPKLPEPTFASIGKYSDAEPAAVLPKLGQAVTVIPRPATCTVSWSDDWRDHKCQRAHEHPGNHHAHRGAWMTQDGQPIDGPAEPESLATEVHELEAIPAGLTAEQQARANALHEAATVAATAGLLDDDKTPEENADVVITIARPFAAWIDEGDGDPAPAQDAAPTKLYVAMVNDRHTEPEAYVFATADQAIGYAASKAREFARSVEDIDEEPIPAWLYHARYSSEGDSVWVLEKTLGEGVTA